MNKLLCIVLVFCAIAALYRRLTRPPGVGEYVRAADNRDSWREMERMK